MKSYNKPSGSTTKKNMNLTAQVADVLKAFHKKPGWRNKTNKLTKTMHGKMTKGTGNLMTEEDIDKLFKNHSKEKSRKVLNQREKESIMVPTKVSTEVAEIWGNYENRNFVDSVKFLKVEDDWDKLLTGLPPDQLTEGAIDALFSGDKETDLTVQFKKDYLVGKIIGEGAYASVRVAVYKPLNRKIAIKVYEKVKIKDLQRKKSVRREIRILQLLDHGNIVKIFDVVETNNHLNIVMEYLNGTSLGSYLKAQQGGRIADKSCKTIFRQLAKALKYMHSSNIAHRDIKLENIILDDNLSPKLIDFGFSTCIEPGKKIKIFCGTPSYMAPEVVQRKEYRGETADIWALGVLLFVSLTGIFPFKGSTDQELYRTINNAEYPKSQVSSRSAADLISRMLQIDPQARINSSEILQHSWLCDPHSEDQSILQTDQHETNTTFRKKTTEGSLEFNNTNRHRKRINTISSSNNEKQKPKEIKWSKASNKSGQKKVLAETCKQNLNIELKMGFKSPTHQKQINSYRRKIQVADKENRFKFLKSEKTTHRDKNNTTHLIYEKEEGSKKNIVSGRKKDKGIKAQSKVIDLLRMEMKKRQNEKSKSKSKNKRV